MTNHKFQIPNKSQYPKTKKQNKKFWICDFGFVICLWFVVCSLCIGSIGLLSGCGHKKTFKDAEFIMGTVIEVTSPDPRAKDIVFAEFKRLEHVFSIFDPTSELSLLNSSGEMEVSSDLFDILKKSKEFYAETDGAFDVTVGPVTPTALMTASLSDMRPASSRIRVMTRML